MPLVTVFLRSGGGHQVSFMSSFPPGVACICVCSCGTLLDSGTSEQAYRGPCLNGTLPWLPGELLEEAQLPIRAADQPGVLQAQPGSGNRCQALAETCCQACALTLLQGHLISNSGQRQSSTEVLAKHRDSSCLKAGGLLVCLSHTLHAHEYCSSCSHGPAEGTSLAMVLCRA